MDIGLDFIKPEFLNILFFQQKNLVIFPYVDLKHLHSLEIFTVGFNSVDVESTALHNLIEIIEHDVNNSYSQNPSLYFIFNLDTPKIQEIMNLDEIRCILNTNESVGSLANGSDFIFYNKKNKTFLNYDPNAVDLEFEDKLIKSSENEAILQDRIQKIKILATRIFIDINENGDLNNLPEILEEYDQKYWEKIINFVKSYFKIEVPEFDINLSNHVRKPKLTDNSDEYELIVSLNKNIGKEFIQLLHDYRSKKVNPSNLELDQLYNPQKLYDYLRNHHWKEGISEDFLFEWIQMVNTGFILKDNDINDFETIFKKLGIPDDFILKLFNKKLDINENLSKNVPTRKIERKNKKTSSKTTPQTVPSVKNFPEFKKWLLKRITDIEKLIN